MGVAHKIKINLCGAEAYVYRKKHVLAGEVEVAAAQAIEDICTTYAP